MTARRPRTPGPSGRLMTLLPALALAPALGLAGCAIASDHPTCNAQSVSQCVEYSNVSPLLRSTVATLCAALGGSLEDGTACPTANRLGGCLQPDEGYTAKTFFYKGSTFKSEADISCSATRLDANGNPVTPGADMGSADR